MVNAFLIYIYIYIYIFLYKFWCYPRKILGGGGAGNVFFCVCKYLLLGGKWGLFYEGLFIL